MEQVKQVDRPTTLILDDEVPRVPKRAAFFERALQGDLGEKSQKERSRFSFKHPTSKGLLGVIRSLVPHQGGETAADTDGPDDPEANARAIKALSYHLGSDLTGICEIPRYAWYSHKEDGRPIEPYHKYAVVMLIDQGYDTMEGASGDDWISGTQSMRGYLRGAEIAGVMAEFLRDRGFPARSQTNADSDVLQIPVILWAGLGELSRIGELVLNPFVGPRFKSVVLTTDMPLKPDKPIDFGLQYFCNNCLKCAREARMPVRRHPLRRQGDVQRLRDVEAGRRALHPLPADQHERRGLRALHEDLPDQQGGRYRRAGPDAGRELAGRQRHVPQAADGADRDLDRRQARQRQAQSGQEMVVRPRDHRRYRRRAAGRHQPARHRPGSGGRSGQAEASPTIMPA